MGSPCSPRLAGHAQPQEEMQDRLGKEQSLLPALVLGAGGRAATRGHMGKPKWSGGRRLGHGLFWALRGWGEGRVRAGSVNTSVGSGL